MLVSSFLDVFEKLRLTYLNSIINDKNNQFYNCVKYIKIEQNDLNKVHTAESNISIGENEGNRFRYFLLNFKGIK